FSQDERAMIESACSYDRLATGPAAYYGCLRKQIDALRTLRSRQERHPILPPTPGAPAPPPAPFPTSLGNSPAHHAVWPPWSGPKAIMPGRLSHADSSPDEVYRRVSSSVYVILAARSQHAREYLTDVVQRSAVSVSEDEALTNCHVIADRPTIVIIQNKEMASSTVVRADPGSDRCFIRSDRLKLHPVL